ncbi:MAG: hypothetical protein ACI9MS_003261 [Glaciecola sp.]
MSPHGTVPKTRKTSEERNLAYRELFKNQVDDRLLIDIRQEANKILVSGTKRDVKEVETMTGKRLKGREVKRGKPVGYA